MSKENGSAYIEISIYEPNILWKIGAFMCILFASIYSLLIFIIPITIPTIVFTGISINRSYFVKKTISKKILPIILNLIIFLLTTILLNVFLTFTEDALIWFSESFLNSVPVVKRVIIDPQQAAISNNFFYDAISIWIPLVYLIAISLLVVGWHWKKDIKVYVK